MEYCSKYDLYSKSKVLVDVEQVKPYYISLINKVNNTRNAFKYNVYFVTKLVKIDATNYSSHIYYKL